MLKDEDGNPKVMPKCLGEASVEFECSLSDVVVFLKKCGYALEHCFVSFFSPIFSAYINCGLDPLPHAIKITNEDLQQVTHYHDNR